MSPRHNTNSRSSNNVEDAQPSRQSQPVEPGDAPSQPSAQQSARSQSSAKPHIHSQSNANRIVKNQTSVKRVVKSQANAQRKTQSQPNAQRRAPQQYDPGRRTLANETPLDGFRRYAPYLVGGVALIVVLAITGLVLYLNPPKALSGSSNSATNDTVTSQLAVQDVAATEANAQANSANTAATTTPAVAAPSVDDIIAALPSVIDADDQQALAERAQTDADALWIAQHADDYAFIDSYIQWKMLRLAAYEPQATEFVRNVMDLYPAATGSPWKGTLVAGEVPHLYQWDVSWAYTDYCGLPFGMSGCCPTAFSMVAMYFSGSIECTPYVAGVDAAEQGYAVDYIGSDGSFISNRAGAFGFSAYSTYLDGSGLVAELQAGNLVICNVGPGDFTVGGHFIVATGLASDGTVVVNDPYSTRNSTVTWDADRIANQTKVFYVCSK